MSTNPSVATVVEAVTGGPYIEKAGTCPTHGEFESFVFEIAGKQSPAKCPECLLIEIKAEREAESAQLAAEHQQRARMARLERINLPRRMIAKRWADYNPANARAEKFVQICKNYASNWKSTHATGANLIMTGSTGNGKTHLASVLCKQVAGENAVQPLYTTVSAMLRYIRASFGKGCSYTEAEALDCYALAELLVIDEVGVKLSSEYDKSTLFEIIDMRYQEELPTVVISNLSVKEINEHIDARLVDRLTENGTLMIFDWASHRGQNT